MQRTGISRTNNHYDAVVATPVGRIGLQLRDEALVDVDFLGPSAVLRKPRTDSARRACAQIAAYFDDPTHAFHLPLNLSGTSFQQRVWRSLCRIPAGHTLSYGDLARRLHTSARAVGNACRANPIPLVVPCHRVVAADGLGGFMGKRHGLSVDRKRWLLRHEQGK